MPVGLCAYSEREGRDNDRRRLRLRLRPIAVGSGLRGRWFSSPPVQSVSLALRIPRQGNQLNVMLKHAELGLRGVRDLVGLVSLSS
jgi:hypothetical protein